MIASVVNSIDHELLGNKLVIPDHNVLMVPLDTAQEANYLCGVLNSEIVNDFAIAYISWFYSSHILEHINIPNFDANNKEHLKISELSKMAHKKGELTNSEQADLNSLVVKILGNN